GGDKPLIRINVENPVAAHRIEGTVAGGGKIPVPLVMEQAGTIGRHDLRRRVGRTSVDDNDFVNVPAKRFETAADHGGFVAYDQSGGYLQMTPAEPPVLSGNRQDCLRRYCRWPEPLHPCSGAHPSGTK